MKRINTIINLIRMTCTYQSNKYSESESSLADIYQSRTAAESHCYKLWTLFIMVGNLSKTP